MIGLIAWIAITVFYVWSIGDTGRTLGANTKDAYENYVEYYTKEYIGTEGIAEAATDAWSYTQFNDLEQKFKSSMIGISVKTCVYMVATIALYHATIRKNESIKKEMSGE